MTVTVRKLSPDFTLELGDNPSPAHFLAATRAFLGYVQEVAGSVAPEGEPIHWVVQVREGSNLIAVTPAPDVDPALARGAYSLMEKGIRQVSKGRVNDSGLSDLALKHLRALSEQTRPNGHAGFPVRLWLTEKPIEVTPQIASAIAEEDSAKYQDIGSIEGRLEAIEDHRGRLQLQIKDALVKQAVRCFFPEEMLTKAFKLFRKRIEVTGTIHYRKNGTPINIDVASIEGLPDDSKLPTYQDVRGILGGTTRKLKAR
jgi:hypothetical protein